MVNYPWFKGGGEKFWSPFSRACIQRRKERERYITEAARRYLGLVLGGAAIPLSQNCARKSAHFFEKRGCDLGGDRVIDTPRPPSSPCSRAAHDCIAGTTRRDVSFRFVSFRFLSFRFVSFRSTEAVLLRGEGEGRRRSVFYRVYVFSV